MSESLSIAKRARKTPEICPVSTRVARSATPYVSVDRAPAIPYNGLMFAPDVYARRRSRFCEALHRRGILAGHFLLLGNNEAPRNYPSNCYGFRQDSSWLYLAGLALPNLALSLDIERGDTVLFADPVDIDDIIWTGALPSPLDLAAQAGIERSAPRSALRALVERATRASDPIYILPPYRADHAAYLGELFGAETSAPGAALAQSPAFARHIDPRVIQSIVELREIKDAEEIAEIEKAVALTAEIHRDILRDLRPGWTEKRAADHVLSCAAARGCELSFSTIATCRGEVLHNAPTEYAATERDTFLLDAGAEAPSGYAGDLTTSFPVGTRFGPRSRDIYLVLQRAFAVATASLGPGVRFIDAHRKAAIAIAEGLTALGIMRGDPREAVEAGAHALFFPHGLGHQIGLDVHDMEALGEDIVGYGDELSRSAQFGLRSLRLAKTLKPGMVHSVEPGIYFIPQLAQKWRAERICTTFINYDTIDSWMAVRGLRIEEDWCVTERGARRLGPAFNKSADALESARSTI